MRMRLSQIIVSFAMTLLLLIISEIVTSTLLPAVGWHQYRLTFNVLIILFMAIRLNTPLLPWLILALQMVHAVFSIEGWALGTFAGLIMMVVANFLKEVLQLSNAIMTMVTVQIFQILWFLIVSLIICLKISNFENFGMLVWSFVPGSILLSIISPFIFWVLESIWKGSRDGGHAGVEI